jgi:transposase-like protein
MVSVKDLIKLVKELPEESLVEVHEYVTGVKEKVENAKKSAPITCVVCGLPVVKNGKSRGNQQYLCKHCGKAFSERSTNSMSNSHSSDTVWKAVIRDTIEGVSLDKTANDIEVAHSTVFHMRHKILYAIEQEILENPVFLEGACELDETYVLECEKGTVLPDDYHREPRNNGKASRRGLSEEWVCLCTATTSRGEQIAKAVNRATPSKDEIEQVFGNRIEDDTLLLVDGNKSYNTLKDRTNVVRTSSEDLVKTNRFHSFIKERIARARGVATKNLNRYAALFSQIFGCQIEAPDRIFVLLKKRGTFVDIETIKTKNLLLL